MKILKVQCVNFHVHHKPKSLSINLLYHTYLHMYIYTYIPIIIISSTHHHHHQLIIIIITSSCALPTRTWLGHHRVMRTPYSHITGSSSAYAHSLLAHSRVNIITQHYIQAYMYINIMQPHRNP